jgi:tetratricopeptide (TPR) repeat protein
MYRITILTFITFLSFKATAQTEEELIQQVDSMYQADTSNFELLALKMMTSYEFKDYNSTIKDITLIISKLPLITPDERIKAGMESILDSVGLLNFRAQCYNRIGQIEKAIRDYGLAYSFEKDELKYNMNIARSYIENDKYDSAKQFYSTILESHPKNIIALNNITICFDKLNKTKYALKHINKSIKLEPNHYISYKIKGDIYNRLTKKDKACDLYNISLTHLKLIEQKNQFRINPEFKSDLINKLNSCK